uniref:Uncharacterized protein n=1 Tax=Chromera velia CCMP2878 TaxID=1169474 RepID=A0A0G4HED6_9ALVE|eukprot:Cvel_26627.t1-p1 / transcript=Cvel_26627.t1 / gene=Cvel_26627 / organism=Chromera_velia_CCMP2878 / gene_product=Putative ankyrin repeat protein RF_0381, putative / transcript_product=Putative ankyrin repeat protein RF_0381, putative / location=Cvel_scaffold3198:15588-17411(-) / protein_length=608 / sequence_SO=supercontig / SO=protein_coding / is_pseudo=false
METLPASFLCVLRDMENFEEAVTRVADSFREKRRVVTNAVCCSLGIPSLPSDFSLSQAVFENDPPPPPPRVAAALIGLSGVAATTLQKLKKEAHSKLDQILSHYYKIDLSPFFASEVGKVIRSFQAVDAPTLCQAARACTGEGPQGIENLSLLLRVGANVNVLVDGKSPLVEAVSARSLPAVEMLVEEGADIERRGEEKGFEGFTALHRACYESHPEIVRFLVSREADVNVKDKMGRTSLTYAAYKGPLEIFEHLLSKGADLEKSVFDGVTALHQATAGNQKEIAEMLLDHGTDVNARNNGGETPLFWTAFYNTAASIVCDSDAVAELLLARGADVNARDEMGRTIVHWAATHGSMKVLKVALDAGADIEALADGSTPLMCTATMIKDRVFDSDAAAELLLDREADVNASGWDGRTVLHAAASYGCVKVLQLALDRGADIEARDREGKTPLHTVFRSKSFYMGSHHMVGNPATAGLLLSRGADMNAREEIGRTILHLAAIYGCLDILKFALDHGADVNAIDNRGDSALHHVVWCRNDRDSDDYRRTYDSEGTLEAAQMLVDHGTNASAENGGGLTPLAIAEFRLPEGSPTQVFLSGLRAQDPGSTASK